MTQLVGRLAESGLVARLGDPDDGRVVHVQLTDEGREFIASRRTARAQRLAGLLAALSDADKAALAAALPAMEALVRAHRAKQAAAAGAVAAGHARPFHG